MTTTTTDLIRTCGGCTEATVGTVRAERIAEAERTTKAAQRAMAECFASMLRASVDLIILGADPTELLSALTTARDASTEAAEDAARVAVDAGATGGPPFDKAVIEPLLRNYVYGGVVTELSAILAEVEASGVEFPLPPQLPLHRLTELITEAVTALGAVQIGQPSPSDAPSEPTGATP